MHTHQAPKICACRIDPDSSRNVLIEDSVVTTNDDCIAIKAGADCAGVAYGLPSENIVIRNLTCYNGITIGSEMSGGVRNVSISNSTGRLYIKTGPARGGFVTDVAFRDILIPSQHGQAQKYGLRVTTSYGGPSPFCNATWNPAPTRLEGLSFVGVRCQDDFCKFANW